MYQLYPTYVFILAFICLEKGGHKQVANETAKILNILLPHLLIYSLLSQAQPCCVYTSCSSKRF